MKPPYSISPLMMQLVSSISLKLGEVQASLLIKQSPQLRKQNRIKTIHASLQIEGNTLTEEQITAIVENRHVIGPSKDILEVLNAIKVYEQLNTFDFSSEKSFLKAHGILMHGLVERAGSYRNKGVGIVKGSDVQHIAPPHVNVPNLVKELFKYVRYSEELVLIKSCVFHYEIEFIHPFVDGNGRMGRLWQTLILMEQFPVFEFLPLESLISDSQEAYYRALVLSDKAGNSCFFIEYMLGIINKSLEKLLDYKGLVLKVGDRLNYFILRAPKEFTKQDYTNMFKNISSATASRDLKKGVQLGYFESIGQMNQTRYRLKSVS